MPGCGCETCGREVRWVESYFPEFAPDGTDETIINHPCGHKFTRPVSPAKAELEGAADSGR